MILFFIFVIVAIVLWVIIAHKIKSKKEKLASVRRSHERIVDTLESYHKLIVKGAKYNMMKAGELQDAISDYGVDKDNGLRTLEDYNSYIQRFENLRPLLETLAQSLSEELNTLNSINDFLSSKYNKPIYLQSMAVPILEGLGNMIFRELDDDFEHRYQDALMAYMGAYKSLKTSFDNKNHSQLSVYIEFVMKLYNSIKGYQEAADKAIRDDKRLTSEANKARQSVIDSIERLRKLVKGEGTTSETIQEVTEKTTTAINRLQEFGVDPLINFRLARDIMKGWDLLERKIYEELVSKSTDNVLFQEQYIDLQRKLRQDNFDERRRTEEKNID